MIRVSTLLLGLHALAIVLLIGLFAYAPTVTLPSLGAKQLHTSLLQWDAVWYNLMRAKGYYYQPDAISTTAFFPFFPLVWNLSRLTPLGVSLLNFAIAGVALFLLYRHLRLRPVAVLLFTAFPSCIFLYLPYTEALFFAFSSLVLLSLAGLPKRPAALAGAMWLGALTRVTSFFYLPALATVELVEGLQAAAPRWGVRVRRLLAYGLATGLGLGLVMLYQRRETGVWFAYTKQQAEQFDHHFRLPHLPFTTGDNAGVLWLDGLALLVGLAAGAWALRAILLVVRKQAPAPNRLVLFSAVSVAASMLHTLLFAPLLPNGQTSLLCMHRYVLCTPFFLILLNEFVPRTAVSGRTVLRVLLPVIGLAVLLGMAGQQTYYVQILRVSVPGLVYAGFLIGYAWLWLQAGTKWGRAVLYLSNLVLQLFFLYTFTTGNWVA